MNKSSKMLIIVASIVLLILGTLTCIVFYFASLEPERIEYPGSGLSGSIFDVQNSEYKPNGSFPEQYGYKNIPYVLDVPASTSAVVDDGSVWRLSNQFYLFTTEIPFNGDINTIIGHELGKIILLDCDDNRTLFDELKEESGYRNGFGALYQIKKMYLSNGEKSVETLVMLYLIELPGEKEDIIVGTLCLNETNENIRNMKDYTDALFMTFRYSEEHSEELEKRARQQAYDDANAERKKAQEEMNAERQQAIEEAKAEQEEKSAVVTSETAINVEKEYIKLRVDVSWRNYNSVQSLELVSPSGEYYPGTLADEKNGYIEVGSAQSGQWSLRITGVNVGEVDITLTELDESGSSETYQDIGALEVISTEEETVTTVTEG